MHTATRTQLKDGDDVIDAWGYESRTEGRWVVSVIASGFGAHCWVSPADARVFADGLYKIANEVETKNLQAARRAES